MSKVHTAVDQLILETKDLSMFPIKRVVTEFEKYWEVTDLRKAVYTQRYRTKFGAEQAVCAAIKTAMAGK
jgi:ribosomal protein L7/L12